PSFTTNHKTDSGLFADEPLIAPFDLDTVRFNAHHRQIRNPETRNPKQMSPKHRNFRTVSSRILRAFKVQCSVFDVRCSIFRGSKGLAFTSRSAHSPSWLDLKPSLPRYVPSRRLRSEPCGRNQD